MITLSFHLEGNIEGEKFAQKICYCEHKEGGNKILSFMVGNVMLIVIFREIEYNEGKCVVSILPATYYAYCGSENKPRQKREITSCFYFPQCNNAPMKVPYIHFLAVERQFCLN